MNKTSDGLSKIDLHMDQKQALFLKKQNLFARLHT